MLISPALRKNQYELNYQFWKNSKVLKIFHDVRISNPLKSNDKQFLHHLLS